MRGDSTPPCGVPLFTSLVWVEVPSVAVSILLISNLWINCYGKHVFEDSLYVKEGDKCMYSLMLSDFSMLVTTQCSADSVYS